MILNLLPIIAMGLYLFLANVAATIFKLLVAIFYMVSGKIIDQENKIIASTPSLPSYPSQSPIMALSPSLPSSSQSRSWEHDVFPSFHGPDVRKHVLNHILKDFRSKGIDPFIDNEIKRGESIGPELKRAIKESKIAIVLLSKNYASSSWCLDELVEIMNKVLGQTVLTIFYDVDPTDVKKQTGYFGKVFKKTCRGKTEEKIGTWRNALEGVATIAGYHSSKWDDESAMIENIASDISKMLNPPPRRLDSLIGMRAHMERMELLLGLDLKNEVRMIGIWGPPGIGKSTIARFLFNEHSNSFPLSAIMVNIRGSYPKTCLDEGNAQLEIQMQMLSQLTKEKDIKITHLGVARDRLKNRRVLLVLDEVDQLAQLDALAGDTQWFGPGSRIIITTEDLSVLIAHGINHVYQVAYPSTDEAFQMFCMYAFGQKFPKDGFKKLAHEVVYLVGDLPLGLQVMGSHFKGKSKQEWIMELPRVRVSLDKKIESVLRFSYDALSCEDQRLFIHIACLFHKQVIENVIRHLVKSFTNVRQGLRVLAKKSLISFTHWGFIEMHSLLVQLGETIVREQYDIKPRKRPILVDGKDIREVLTDPTSMTASVVGINSTYMSWGDISERAFEGLPNLQFLRVSDGVGDKNMTSLSGLTKYISPKLQLLDWRNSPMTCLPFNINMENLVELNMVNSKLEKLWEGIKSLQNLKWINLMYSRNLKELPNLSTATSLQTLYLGKCSSLVELPSSLCVLSLKKIDLNGCSSLVELPSCIGHAIKLQELNLSSCSSLTKLPSSIGNATNLLKLILGNCSSLVKLPSSIGKATNLQELELSCCASLVKLPSSIGNLNRLKGLNLRECSKFDGVFPTNINYQYLNELDLTGCSLLQSFPEISKHIKFLYLVGTAIKEVPLSIRSWSRLKELEISYHENLKNCPHAFDSITELHLTDKGIQEIDPWVKECSRLVQLDVSRCTKLESLPQLPDSISELNAENCVTLKRLDCSLRNPYICLNFVNCVNLNQEARDLIIHTSTRKSNVSVLPGGEVPACFTYRSCGSFVTVELNEKPLRRSTKFKACIVLVGMDEEDEESYTVKCSITSKQNPLTSWRSCGHTLKTVLPEHLYIFDLEAEFDFEAEEVPSTELVFEFELAYKFQFGTDYDPPGYINKCGVLQLLEPKIHEDHESFGGPGEDSDEERSNRLTWGSSKRVWRQ